MGQVGYCDLGRVSYRKALQFQHDLRDKRIKGVVSDHILLLEHDPVFTLGKRRIESDFVVPREEIIARGIDIVETNRGGRVTYHGPGQLVAYFIFDLHHRGVRLFVSMLAEVCKLTVYSFGVMAEVDMERPGLWFGREKIAAIGLNIENGVSMHGIALNVDMDLAPYSYIVACGMADRGVTTLAKIINQSLTVDDVKTPFLQAFEEVFDLKCVRSDILMR